jgi:hypothetical protein
MDPVRNPYTPSAGTRPPALTGRDSEIRGFDILVQRLKIGQTEKSMMLTGLRGVGKTVLLTTFADIGESHGFFPTVHEITEGANFPAIMARLARKTLLSMNPIERLRDKARRALSILKAFSIRIPDGPEIGLDIDAAVGTADSGDITEDLPELFAAIGEAAIEEGRGVLFFLDEIHHLKREHLAGLIAAVHRATQQSLPLAVIGAGLPQLPGLAGTAKSYAERLFDFPFIDSLPYDAAAEAITRPAEDLGVTYDEDAVDHIVELAEGYPYFLQEYGKHVWNIASQSPITVEDVHRAEDPVRSQLDENFFLVRLWRVTNAERRYMRAMAELGPGTHRSSDIADALGQSVRSVAPTRSNLIHKSLVYSPGYGVTAFTVPQFDDFLRRVYPVDLA